MSLFKSKKSINYIGALKKNKQKKQINKAVVGVLSSLISFVVILGAVYGYIVYNNNAMSIELADMNSYINDASNVEAFNQVFYNENTVLVDLQARKSNLQVKIDEIIAMPVITKEDFESIMKCTDDSIIVERMSFDNTKSIFTIEAYTSSPLNIPEYIERLNNTGVFQQVEHVGYQSTGDGKYSFELSCILKVVADNE